MQAVSLFLDQYITLYDASTGDCITGAAYADANAVIPGRLILAVIALLVADAVRRDAFIGRWRLPLIGTGLLIARRDRRRLDLPVGDVEPPGGPERGERRAEPTSSATSTATQQAYGVSGRRPDPLQREDDRAGRRAEGGRADDGEDPHPRPGRGVARPFGQFQQFKQYYQFPDNLDVDRYTIDGKSQDAVVAVRELNQSGLERNRNGYNDTFVYTHGYGFVAAYGNQRSPDGTPVFFESRHPRARARFGSLPAAHLLRRARRRPTRSSVRPKGTKPVELDYARADAAAARRRTTTFTGNGGPKSATSSTG